MTELRVLQPFESDALVTTSSRHGHHTPYGGNVSCDSDVFIPSRGVPVALRLEAEGQELRAVVDSVRPSCATGRLEDGGQLAQLSIERRNGDGWTSTGLRVLYAHLDPVLVSVGDVVTVDGTVIGLLGPATAQSWPNGSSLCGNQRHGADDPRSEEYHSRCCVHSHVHIEAFGAKRVVGRGATVRPGDEMVAFDLVGVPARPTPRPAAPAAQAAQAASSGVATAAVSVASTYKVQKGDTLGEVAARLGIPLSELVAANPELIEPGQVLELPAQVYTVVARDTLGEIAKRFGVTVDALAEANSIANVNLISIGQRLVIPRAATA